VLRSYEVTFGVGDAPSRELIDGKVYRRVRRPSWDALTAADRQLVGLDRSPITEGQRERIRVLREAISQQMDRLASHRGL
jgi:hypothetical protein